jgi:energy-converting hydrogenase A subunit M
MNEEENKKIFSENRDPFKDFEIRMCIICDLEQGGKLTEEEAFKQVKELYKEFKKYYKENMKDGS